MSRSDVGVQSESTSWTSITAALHNVPTIRPSTPSAYWQRPSRLGRRSLGVLEIRSVGWVQWCHGKFTFHLKPSVNQPKNHQKHPIACSNLSQKFQPLNLPTNHNQSIPLSRWSPNKVQKAASLQGPRHLWWKFDFKELNDSTSIYSQPFSWFSWLPDVKMAFFQRFVVLLG